MYPFLFRSMPDPNADDKWFVKIARCFDYVDYNSSWMDSKELGNTCLVPDVDLMESIHEFDSEVEAIEFIRQWWRSH